MTLVVRDEADILDAQIAYHLNAGVDFVIAIDHRSVDGTTEILESYARAGAAVTWRARVDALVIRVPRAETVCAPSPSPSPACEP